MYKNDLSGGGAIVRVNKYRVLEALGRMKRKHVPFNDRSLHMYLPLTPEQKINYFRHGESCVAYVPKAERKTNCTAEIAIQGIMEERFDIFLDQKDQISRYRLQSAASPKRRE